MPRLRGVGKVYDAWDSTHAAEVSVRFEFRKMTDEEAQEIAGWRYVPPYDFYDSVSDPDDLAELLDSHRRGDDYFLALDEKGTLVGLFQFKRDGKVVGVGLRLRPDLTGKGLGHGFLVAGLEFARWSFSPEVFSLSVATFNERAIKVYEGGPTATRLTAGCTSSWKWSDARKPVEPRHKHSREPQIALFLALFIQRRGREILRSSRCSAPKQAHP